MLSFGHGYYTLQLLPDVTLYYLCSRDREGNVIWYALKTRGLEATRLQFSLCLVLPASSSTKFSALKLHVVDVKIKMETV